MGIRFRRVGLFGIFARMAHVLCLRLHVLVVGNFAFAIKVKVRPKEDAEKALRFDSRDERQSRTKKNNVSMLHIGPTPRPIQTTSKIMSGKSNFYLSFMSA